MSAEFENHGEMADKAIRDARRAVREIGNPYHPEVLAHLAFAQAHALREIGEELAEIRRNQ